MGHVNDFVHDSFWRSKGILRHDFADKQLKVLELEEKVYHGTNDFDNIFYFHPKETNTTFTFPNKDMKTSEVLYSFTYCLLIFRKSS